MMYLPEIQAAAGDPEALEEIYQDARRAKDEAAFREALQACYQRAPDNLLYAAWHVRLRQSTQERDRTVNWKLAVPLSVALGLIFWALTAKSLELPGRVPYLALAWTSIAACAVLAFLAVTCGKAPLQHIPESTLVVVGQESDGIRHGTAGLIHFGQDIEEVILKTRQDHVFFRDHLLYEIVDVPDSDSPNGMLSSKDGIDAAISLIRRKCL